jgi:transcriptional regulator with XRE-family HTH domain
MEEVDDDVSSKGDNVPLRFRRTKKYVQNKQFGEYIKKERKKRRLTQFDVAEALQRIMGDVVSNTRIQRYESGARFCDYATALKLAEAIGIPEYEMVANWVSAYGDMQGMGAEGQYILTAYAALPPEAKVKFIEMVESIQELPDPDRISMLKMLIAFQNTIAPDISSIRRRG